jgi:D-tyrosyl-tRNA(Tyr) deacylase
MIQEGLVNVGEAFLLPQSCDGRDHHRCTPPARLTVDNLTRPMRLLLQRVARAEVRIEARVAGRIERGFLLLVGFTHADGEDQLTWMADKIIGLRIFSDAHDKMNLALADVGGAILVVSQFTLYGDAAKGRRPSFVDAARPELAQTLYERFIARLRDRDVRVETGEFGAMMQVELVNDGPVTLWFER